MSDVLIDSSAWIDFLRGDAKAVEKVDLLLADGRAAMTGPIYAEVVSGAQSRAVFDRLALLFKSLDLLVAPEGAWEQVAEARFALARQGIQVHLVDLFIAVTALHNRHSLLTRDRDFEVIARVIPVELDCF